MLTFTRIDGFIHTDVWPIWLTSFLTFTFLKSEKPGKDYQDRTAPAYRNTHQMNRYKKALFVRTEDGGGVFLAGLLPDVLAECEKNSLDYKIADRRRPFPDTPDFTKITGDLRYRQDEALKKIVSNDKGIILCCTAFGKSFIISQLCVIYHKARIVIVSAKSSVVASLYSRIVALTGSDEVGKICSGTPRSENNKRILVSTSKSLMRCSLGTCDILIYDEVHNVGDNQTAQFILSNIGPARMYGFTASLYRGDKALPVVTGLFGKVLMTVDYQEAVDNDMVTPLDVLMIPVEKSPDFVQFVPSQTGDETYNHRNAYWRNMQRNGEIAKIVSILTDQFPDEQILIMVESLEHAVILQKTFPVLQQFAVVHYGKASKERVAGYDTAPYKLTAKERDNMRKKFENQELKYVIATKTWSEGVDFKYLSILIRADGGISSISSTQIPGRAARKAAGKDRSLIIDFMDNFDTAWALPRSLTRKRFYAEKGWLV